MNRIRKACIQNQKSFPRTKLVITCDLTIYTLRFSSVLLQVFFRKIATSLTTVLRSSLSSFIGGDERLWGQLCSIKINLYKMKPNLTTQTAFCIDKSMQNKAKPSRTMQIVFWRDKCMPNKMFKNQVSRYKLFFV